MVYGLGFKGVGFLIERSAGLRVKDLECRVLGLKVYGPGSRV